jgi:hypothetical protein
LPKNHTGPCPKCGKVGREISVVLIDTIKVTDSVRWQTRREYYQKNPKVLAVVIGITVVSPFLGFVFAGWLGVVVGLVLGGIAYWIGPRASTKIIEIHHG